MADLTYAETLTLVDALRAPALRQAIAGLDLPAGSRGLDLGCGHGRHTLWLAEAVGPAGHVTGLDVDEGSLASARALAATSPVGERVEFRRGDALNLDVPAGSADWLYCADLLWPGALTQDPVAVLRGLARVVRPGGTVALVYWSSQRLLAGHPRLEARLDVAHAAINPYLSQAAGTTHYLRALAWFPEAGLVAPTACTYLADVRAPLSADERAALLFCLDMFWGGAQEGHTADERAEYQRLCDGASPDCVLDQPGYYAFLTYTVFAGRLADATT